MPIPAAANTPQLAGIASPEVWSPKLLQKFYSASVTAAISNTDYEGEISTAGKGAKVMIRTVGDAVVKPYVKNQDMVMDNIEPGLVELEIDKAYYWFHGIDSIDRFQSDIDYMEAWTNDASMQSKKYVDLDCLAYIYTMAHASNKGASAGKISSSFNMGATGAPFQVTSANVLDLIIDCGNVLDEQDVPEEDRHLVLPAWACGMIKKSDIKNASITGDNKSTLRNGRIGEIDRFTVYSSNLLPWVNDTTRCWHAVAGQKAGLSFANNFIENKVFATLERRAGSAVRGVAAYGRKVLKSEAVIDLYIRK